MALTLKSVRASCVNVQLNPDEFIRKDNANIDYLKIICQDFPDTIQPTNGKKLH